MARLDFDVEQLLVITETTETISEDDLIMATEVIGESTRAAMDVARAWIKHGAAQETAENSEVSPPEIV